MKKKLTTQENPIFTSVAFSKNSKRIVASSYDLINENQRKIELFVLRVDYGDLKIQMKFTMNYIVPAEPLDMIKHLDFLEIDKKRKLLMTIGLHKGKICLLSTKREGLEVFIDETPIGNENLVSLAFYDDEAFFLLKNNQIHRLKVDK